MNSCGLSVQLLLRVICSDGYMLKVNAGFHPKPTVKPNNVREFNTPGFSRVRTSSRLASCSQLRLAAAACEVTTVVARISVFIASV